MIPSIRMAAANILPVIFATCLSAAVPAVKPQAAPVAPQQESATSTTFDLSAMLNRIEVPGLPITPLAAACKGAGAACNVDSNCCAGLSCQQTSSNATTFQCKAKK